MRVEAIFLLAGLAVATSNRPDGTGCALGSTCTTACAAGMGSYWSSKLIDACGCDPQGPDPVYCGGVKAKVADNATTTTSPNTTTPEFISSSLSPNNSTAVATTMTTTTTTPAAASMSTVGWVLLASALAIGCGLILVAVGCLMGCCGNSKKRSTKKKDKKRTEPVQAEARVEEARPLMQQELATPVQLYAAPQATSYVTYAAPQQFVPAALYPVQQTQQAIPMQQYQQVQQMQQVMPVPQMQHAVYAQQPAYAPTM